MNENKAEYYMIVCEEIIDEDVLTGWLKKIPNAILQLIINNSSEVVSMHGPHSSLRHRDGLTLQDDLRIAMQFGNVFYHSAQAEQNISKVQKVVNPTKPGRKIRIKVVQVT